MQTDHPLVDAAKGFLRVGAAEALRSARETNGRPALTHRQHLRLTTCFSGMGGGEMIGWLVAQTTGLDVRLASQCDVIPEALGVPLKNQRERENTFPDVFFCLALLTNRQKFKGWAWAGY